MTFLRPVVERISKWYPTAKRYLHKFHGGVFPKYFKELSSHQPVIDDFIPDTLRIPLHQQVGLPPEVLVKVGEVVNKNQLIARSSKDATKALIVPIHAPTSGVISAIEANTLPHPSGLTDLTIIIEPDKKNTALDNILQVDGTTPTSTMKLKQIILDAGIVGIQFLKNSCLFKCFLVLFLLYIKR